MSRAITIHPASLAAGLGLGVVFCLLIGAAQIGWPGPHLPRVRVDGIPAPYQMVRLMAADFPYTVPASQTLVITGVGQLPVLGGLASYYADVALSIGGQPAIRLCTNGPDSGGSALGGNCLRVIPGIAVSQGTQVSVSSNGPAPFVILGYLAPL